MANDNLGAARKAKNDEFYTQYHDIEKEMNAYVEFNADVFRDKTILLPCDDPEWSNFTKYFAQNFERLGLKKLISTSYAPNSKPKSAFLNPTLFETEDPQYDEIKSVENGKIFTLDRDINGDHRTDVNDLRWSYLDGDGDFRGAEVTKLRDEADIVITNPPFSLFREFLAWIVAGGRECVIIGNMNAITYKEVFPLIRDDKLWLGATANGSDLVFRVPEGYDVAPGDREKAAKLGYVGNYTRLGNACWFTTLEHGRRHEPIPLMTKEENIRFSKHKNIRDVGYKRYDNYDAIEVPHVDAIPSDFDGVMGVPITFLGKYTPEQFEIIGCSYDYGRPEGWPKSVNMAPTVHGVNIYKRILIQHRKTTR